MIRLDFHRLLRYLRKVRPWHFLILTVVFGATTLYALRANNYQMGRLRDAVFVADKKNGDVEGALQNLRTYVAAHMNTNLSDGPNAPHPPIQLQYTYERLQAAQQKQLGENHGSLYGEAERVCSERGQTATAGQAINCIQEYASAHGIQLAEVPDKLYKFDFVSARWSPDLAGLSMVATALSVLGFCLTVLHGWLIKRFS